MTLGFSRKDHRTPQKISFLSLQKKNIKLLQLVWVYEITWEALPNKKITLSLLYALFVYDINVPEIYVKLLEI